VVGIAYDFSTGKPEVLRSLGKMEGVVEVDHAKGSSVSGLS
jgi:hypothetical protein